MTAPIVVFAFNRPDLLQRVLTCLAGNTLADRSSVTIFCDGPRDEHDEVGTLAVRKLAKTAQGFASIEVVERACNIGCAASIINGLTEMFRQHERLIVIEDDIVTSPYTLDFLNRGLDHYADNEKIFNISAWSPPNIANYIPNNYHYDVYAIPRFNCWGWASWKNRFQDIDWEVKDYNIFKNSETQRNLFNQGGSDLSSMLDAQMEGKLDTWDIRADYARFKKKMYGINPIRSYSLNIGMGSGTHTKKYTTYWDSDITLAVNNPRFIDNIFLDKNILKTYQNCYNKQKLSIVKRIINKLFRLFFRKTIFPNCNFKLNTL